MFAPPLSFKSVLLCIIEKMQIRRTFGCWDIPAAPRGKGSLNDSWPCTKNSCLKGCHQRQGAIPPCNSNTGGESSCKQIQKDSFIHQISLTQPKLNRQGVSPWFLFFWILAYYREQIFGVLFSVNVIGQLKVNIYFSHGICSCVTVYSLEFIVLCLASLCELGKRNCICFARN